MNAIPITNKIKQFLSTFLNSFALNFSWMIPLDSVAPAIAVKINPALSGSR